MNIQHLEDEIANSITSGLGIILSLVGVPVMVSYAVFEGSISQIWAVSIYSLSLLMTYLMSTLYHSFQQPSLKHIFRILDHISIFFLIAGTYTPFILIFMEGMYTILYMIIVWSIVLIGTFYKIFFINKFRLLSLLLYLGMGWLVIFIGKPIFDNLSYVGIMWLAAGGAFYTMGVLFYVWHKLRYHHAIWHMFVLLGSISHYIAILYAMGSDPTLTLLSNINLMGIGC